MLRWHRLGFSVAFDFSFECKKLLVACNPRTLVIGFCTYVNIFPLYEILCYLSEMFLLSFLLTSSRCTSMTLRLVGLLLPLPTCLALKCRRLLVDAVNAQSTLRGFLILKLI
jgi:hypothetical protein